VRGELVEELSGFVDWILEMNPQEAKRAIARDVASSARAEAEKQVLLRTDHLAAWANEKLIFDDTMDAEGAPIWWSQIGNLESDPALCLLPNYRRWLEKREPVRAYGQRNFKNKLIDLLRDTIGLPLPPGDHSKGLYRVDGTGSVVPFVRLRKFTDGRESPGIIDAAFAKRIAPLSQRFGNDRNPVGNGTNELNGSLGTSVSYGAGVIRRPSVGIDDPLGESKAASIHSSRLFHLQDESRATGSVSDSFGSGADAFGDEDDPAWGPRPEVA
jgi:hypothetical protein